MLSQVDHLAVFPQPPVDMVCPPGPQTLITAVLSVICMALLALCLADWRKTGSALMLVATLGGALTSLNEPIMDILARVWFADAGGQWSAFESFGRPIPVWLPMAYLAFFGSAPYLVARYLRDRVDVKRWGLAVAVLATLNATLEMPLLQVSLYTYYGYQPYSVLGFPLYMAVINALGVMLTSVIILRFGHTLTGARSLALMPLPVFAQLTAAGIGVPAFVAANSGVTGALLWVATSVPLLAGGAAFHLLRRVACAPGSTTEKSQPSIHWSLGRSFS